MIYTKGDLFNPESYGFDSVDAICITTNGVVKPNGDAVMGKGLAEQAAKRWPSMPKTLGAKIQFNGHCVLVIGPKFSFDVPYAIVSFPTKTTSEQCDAKQNNIIESAKNLYKPGDWVPGYHCKSRLDFIRTSCQWLKELTKEEKWERVAIPIPGIGNGELLRDEVLAMLSVQFGDDDRFILVERAENGKETKTIN